MCLLWWRVGPKGGLLKCGKLLGRRYFICLPFMLSSSSLGWNSLLSPSTKSPSQLKEFIFHCSTVQNTRSWRIFFTCSPLFKATWLLWLHSFLQFWNMELFLISNAPTSIAEKSLQLATEMARSLTLPRQCGHKDCSDNANLHGHKMMRSNQGRGTGAQGMQFIALGVPAVPSFCD